MSADAYWVAKTRFLSISSHFRNMPNTGFSSHISPYEICLFHNWYWYWSFSAIDTLSIKQGPGFRECRFRFSIFSLGHTKTCQPLQTTANFSPSGRDLSALFGSEKPSTPWAPVFFDFLVRSYNGQNGTILFISGEQLSLNVVGDSAKTLSVLENIGGAVDDCGLRFFRDGGAPLKIPPISGVQRIFFEKYRKIPLAFDYTDPICPPVAISTRIYPQDLRTQKKWH